MRTPAVEIGTAHLTVGKTSSERTRFSNPLSPQIFKNWQRQIYLFDFALIGVIGLIIDYGLKWISQRLTPWADQIRH